MQSRNLHGIVKELSMRDSRIAEFKIRPEEEETTGILYLGFADFRDVDVKIKRTLPPAKDGTQPTFGEFLTGHFSMPDVSGYDGEQAVTVKWLMKPDGSFGNMEVRGGDEALRNEVERLVRLIKWSAAEYRGHHLFALCELTLRLNPAEIKQKQTAAKTI